MRSFYKTKNAFLKKLSQKNKLIMVIELILCVILIFIWFQARSTIETPAFNTYSVILKVTLGFLMLVAGIESRFVYKNGNKAFISWCVLALLCFGMAVDQLFFSL